MKYTIMPMMEAYDIAYKDSPKISNRLEEIESCAVFKLKNGGGVLLPFDSTTGAVFESLADCLEFVDQDRIDEIRSASVLEGYKEEMLNIKTEYKKFISTLEEMIGRDIEVTANIDYLNKLNKDLMKFGKKKIKENSIINTSLGIYIGAVVKEIVNGEWDLFEMNKGSRYYYFIPQIKDSEGEIFLLWNSLIDSLFRNRKFDLVTFIIESGRRNKLEVSGGQIVRNLT